MYYTEGYIKEIRFIGDGQLCGQGVGKMMIILDPIEPYRVTLGGKEFALFVDSGGEWYVDGSTESADTRISAWLKSSNVEYVIGTVMGCEGASSLISVKQNHQNVRIYVEGQGLIVLRLMVK